VAVTGRITRDQIAGYEARIVAYERARGAKSRAARVSAPIAGPVGHVIQAR
jgi:hypothetical protein